MIEVIEAPIYDKSVGGYKKCLIIVLSWKQSFIERADVLVFQLDKIFRGGRNQKRWKLLKRLKSGKESFTIRIIPFFRINKSLNFPKYKMTADEIIGLGNIKNMNLIDMLKFIEKEKS